MCELPYQSLTSGRYCARYNSNRRDGLAIHTSSKQFAMAITIRCAHRSGFMVVGGRTKSLRVYRVKKKIKEEILACDSTRKTSFRMKKKKRGFWWIHAFVSWSALQFNDEKPIPKKTEQPIKGGLCALPFRWSESRKFTKKSARKKKWWLASRMELWEGAHQKWVPPQFQSSVRRASKLFCSLVFSFFFSFNLPRQTSPKKRECS